MHHPLASLLVCLVCAAGLVAGQAAAPPSTPPPPPTPTAADTAEGLAPLAAALKANYTTFWAVIQAARLESACFGEEEEGFPPPE